MVFPRASRDASVYFDPWMAGVVLPGLIVVGLIAIPYIDTNPKGNGYYTFKERPLAITMYLFGWLVSMELSNYCWNIP